MAAIPEPPHELSIAETPRHNAVTTSRAWGVRLKAGNLSSADIRRFDQRSTTPQLSNSAHQIQPNSLRPFCIAPHPNSMSNLRITVERRVIVSSRRFEDILATIDAAVGHPDMRAFWQEIAAASTYPEIEAIVQRAIGPSGFMEFVRFDHGQFLRKAQSVTAPAATPRIVRIVLGNPLIMMAMAKHVHDAGSYAPVTLLIDERHDRVGLSYDTMTSFLGSYGEPVALRVARELDAKVEALMSSAAG